MTYRFVDELSNVWARFQADNVSEAIGMFKLSFPHRKDEYGKMLFTITKDDGQGWIRRIK